MSAVATKHAPTRRNVLAHYQAGGEQRILVGRRIEGEVFVYDYPAYGEGRPYFVERGFGSKAELAVLVADYRRQAGRLDACPMSRSGISAAFDLESH